MRVEYMYGTGKGYSWQPALNYGRNSGLIQPNPKYSTPLQVVSPTTGQPQYQQAGTGAVWTSSTPWDNVFYNYKTQAHDLSFEGVITLNNIRFHKAKTGFNVYFFGGIGATIFETKINAVNGDDYASGTSYAAQYNSIAQGNTFIYENRNDIQ